MAKAEVYANPVRADRFNAQPGANARGAFADNRQAKMVVLGEFTQPVWNGETAAIVADIQNHFIFSMVQV